MKQTVIELNNVELRNDRGGYVFRDLSFSLKAGDAAVIIGQSGSGKSSLVELLVGLRFASAGSVEVFGELLAPGQRRAIRRARRQLGGVGGPFGLLPSLTVAENVTLPLVLAGVGKRTRSERLFKVLTEFSLLQLASSRPDALTRVETTLALLARASIANQPLLVVDEPLAGLDHTTWERVLETLSSIAVSGRSMLIVSAESPPREIPECTYCRIENGTLV